LPKQRQNSHAGLFNMCIKQWPVFFA